ncbi:hypothetical protein [Xylanimonas protaetiae]|uniref:hypothetical protein n=1 Tax=Xylanimonas protaetiae TaxID=2509457 RepID=UPI0026995D7D
MSTAPSHVALRRDGVGVVLAFPATGGLPAVLHWGADLGPLDAAQLAALDTATAPQTPPATLSAAWRLPLLPRSRTAGRAARACCSPATDARCSRAGRSPP